LSQCPTSWKVPATSGLDKIKQAVESCFWPLYEVVDGKYQITYKPVKQLPLQEWLNGQGRFKHLFKPGNEPLLETLQTEVNKTWQELEHKSL